MLNKVAIYLLPVGSLFLFSPSSAQMQACPVNINFDAGNLTRWAAYTGNNTNGNGASAIQRTYSSGLPAPQGTVGATMIEEYGPGTPGIRVITTPDTDPFGGFSTIPTINGYQYKASVLLGSTAVSRRQNGGGGGYVRGISYIISVPAGPVTLPYTMTYAYAMVLENGAHNSNEQPLFSATLQTSAGIITCASPSYYLPTLDNASGNGRDATLDSAAAIANGFSVSAMLSPNPENNGYSLQDVWTKGWTEVTFDLAPYRGQQVTLTFEADNCIPGGHFAYAYIALRDICAGLLISGREQACTNTAYTYSIPSLAGATYHWSVPPDWSVLSGLDGNILTVKVGSQPGTITAREINSCTDLSASLNVTTLPSTISGAISSDNQVCAGNNSNLLTLSNFRGTVLNWLASTDGSTYTPVPNNTSSYTAQNLNTTTIFKALVQNGPACSVDTSGGVTITVDQQTLGGTLSPAAVDVCIGEVSPQTLTLKESRGSILNWQVSSDGTNWFDFDPPNTETSYQIGQIVSSSQYRAVIKNGVCPAINSPVARISLINVPFPRASARPADTIVCFGTPATLNVSVATGSNYSWVAVSGPFEGSRNGTISSYPHAINAVVFPQQSSLYTLTLTNAGCPNKLNLLFNVNVRDRVVLHAGNDTTAVINQPLQLTAVTEDDRVHLFQWSPSIALNDPSVSNPIAVFNGGSQEAVTYRVTATSEEGCVATDDIKVRIFKTSPDIFVPNAFTPGQNTNNLFRPIAAGIATLKYFKVFNRWGQLVYSTSTLGEGWNGMVNGKPQGSGSYVWVLNAVNYLGIPVNKKGFMVLVR